VIVLPYRSSPWPIRDPPQSLPWHFALELLLYCERGKRMYVNVVMKKKIPGKLNYLDMVGS
jgi:hypothetical protein